LSFGFPTEFVKEGAVKVLVPRLETFVKKPWEYAPSKAPVFFNPLMELNRDLAVLALQTYQKMMKRNITACEPLTGCGVRGVRLAREIEGVRKVVINDINPEAAKLAQFNVKNNKLAKRVDVFNEDANLLLSTYAAPRKRFDYVDIDPFGSPAPYMDSAIRALRNGGLVALTATDMAPLCGVHPSACLRKYGGKPLRTEYCHELALRLLIGCLAMTAAKHDVGINIMFSYSAYNHVRTYARVSYGAKEADKNCQAMGYVLHCFECFYRETVKGLVTLLRRDCPECGSKLHTAGPLWLGQMWDEGFCAQMRKEVKDKDLRLRERINKMLTLIIEESKAPATYYVIDKICDRYNIPIPSLSKTICDLRKLGFQAVSTHFNAKAIRTNAPVKIMKETITKLSFSQKQTV
jgi:tRNA (guanine26-N2/guanine27-N2)-dimethyltransferase